MRRLNKSTITIVLSIVLSLSLALTGVVPYVYAAEESVVVKSEKGAPSVDSMSKAINTFAKAITDLTKATSDKEMAIVGIATRFMGVSGSISGGIAVLQALGLIEDGAKKKHEEIMSSIKNIQEQLQNMDNKLNTISDQLTALSASVEEKDRQNKAMRLLGYYRKFNTDYVQPLNDLITEYQGIINDGMSEWWSSSKSSEAYGEAYYVLYTSGKEGEVLTFTDKTTASLTFPTKATNGETVLQDSSMCFQTSFIQTFGLNANNWDVNRQYENFVNAAKGKIVEELNKSSSSKVIVTDEFRKNWNKLSNEEKNKKAEIYATDLLSTVKSRVAVKKMTANSSGFVTRVANAYNNYVKNLTAKDSGVDAIINVQYLTHAFEKETSDDIKMICDSMIASAGFYGEFASSVVAQSKNQTEATALGLRDSMVNAINFIDQKKEKSLTGNPNYCYMTGSVIEYKVLQTKSSMTLDSKASKAYVGDTMLNDRRYVSSSFKSWKVYDSGKETSVPSIVNDTWGNVLLHYYQQQKSGNETFAEFLNKNGVNIPKDFKSDITTKYVGAQNFPLSDNVWMKARRLTGDYFGDYTYYYINDSKKTGKEDKYFPLHDKVVYNGINVANGTYNSNKILAARAAYLEDHWYWEVDEGHVFSTNGANCDVKCNIEGWYKLKYDVNWSADFSVLTLNNPRKALNTNNVKLASYDMGMSSVKLDNDEELDPDSPLDAFDGISYYDAPDDPDIPIEYQDADWDSEDIEYIDEFDYYDDRSGEGIENLIDNAVDRAAEKGIEVNLTDADRQRIVDKMREVTKASDNELQNNDSIRGVDAFGIDDNEERLKALYNKVVYSDEGPGYKENEAPMKNVSTMAFYDPSASIDFVYKDGGIQTIINTEYNIDPYIIEYDSINDEYIYYRVSDEVMKELDLRMKIKLPVNFLNGNDYANIKHYSCDYDKTLIEEFKADILGDEGAKYAEVTVSSCSPFEIEGGGLQYQSVGNKVSHVKAPKTGDDFFLYDLFNIFK